VRICVLIPSYNESKTIGPLVEKIRAKGLDTVVIDDGSLDCTAENAKKSGAFILKHIQNKGKGASLKGGFCYALSKDYDAVVTMDGDGQHSPEDINRFIDTANNMNVDMVVGNRMLSPKDMPLGRWITNNLMSFLISIICWHYIPDSQCGFRLIKRRAIEKLDPISSNYEIESETIIEAYHKGLKIKFIPIQTIYAKQASQISPVVDTIRFFKFILKIFYPFLFNKRQI
jgi:glycosyltransferase involved in cell wall biosynthesis